MNTTIKIKVKQIKDISLGAYLVSISFTLIMITIWHVNPLMVILNKIVTVQISLAGFFLLVWGGAGWAEEIEKIGKK